MDIPRLAWEPKSQVSFEDLEEQVLGLASVRGRATLLPNGTMLYLKRTDNFQEVIESIIPDLKLLFDFEVVPLDVGGFLVRFHDGVSVYVGEDEFKQRFEEILQRLGQLIFEGEGKIEMSEKSSEIDALVGVYARGKLQYDVYNFDKYKQL